MRRRAVLPFLLPLFLLSCKTAPSTPGGRGTGPAGTGGVAAVAAGKAEKVVSLEGLTEYRLDNGLRVVLFPDPSRARVTVNVTYFVGSRHEGYGESGMAHLLEHMLFKGTKTFPDPWAMLEQRGAGFNGSTWLDRTNYYETLPATDENVEWAIAFEADRMRENPISGEVLKKEFSVVRNEFEAGENQPLWILSERMMSTAFLWHNYGKSTIGSRSDIERVPAERLKAFYDRFYQPDNAILIVAGRFDVQKTLTTIEQTFGKIPRPTRKLDPTYTVEPVQDGEREVILRRVGDVGAIGLMYHTVAGAHEDFVAVEAIAEILTHEPSGRLYKAMVKTGKVATVEASTYALAEPGVLEITAEVPAGKPLDKVRDEMTAIVEGIAKEGPTKEEIDRFKSRASKDFQLAMTDSQRIAIDLSEWQAQGDWRLLFVHRDRVEALTPDRVQRVAAEYLKSSNRTVGTFIPTKAPDRSPLPPAPDVAALVNGYKGRAEAEAGEVFEATIANIEKRTTRAKLASGMKVALLPKKTRGKAVRASFRFFFASEKDLKGKTTAAGLMGQMLERGTKKHTYQQITDEYDRLKAEVGIGGGAGEVSVSVTTVRENLPAVLELVAEILQQPTFPKDQLEILRKEQLSDLEQRLTDPEELAWRALYGKLQPYPPDDVRYVPTVPESIARLKAVKHDEIKRFHRDFLGASHAVASIVGDFDAAEITPLLEKHFGGWKSPRPWARIVTPYKAETPADEKIDTPDKENAMLAVALNVELRDDDPDYPAMEMTNYLVGGASDSRLFTRLRQKEGWSYGAFSFVSADAFDRRGEFVAGAIAAPQNTEKALAAAIEEIRRFLDKGTTPAELDKAKQGWRRGFDNQLASDRWIVSSLTQALYEDRTLEKEQKLADAMAKLTPEQLLQVARKYVVPERFVKVRAGDWKKAKP